MTLAATDPANPFGAALPWPDARGLGRPPARPQGRRPRRPGRRRAHPLRRARRQDAADLVATTPTPARRRRRTSLVRGRATRRAGPADGREGRRRADPRRRLRRPLREALDAAGFVSTPARAEAAWLTVPEGDTVWRAARLLDRALRGRALIATDFRVPAFATGTSSGPTVTRDRRRAASTCSPGSTPTRTGPSTPT